MGLEQYLLAAASEKSFWEMAEKEKITDCMECGACTYACPAKRPLLDYIRLGKTTVMRMARERITK
jgi:electron transport complex protein RnfC